MFCILRIMKAFEIVLQLYFWSIDNEMIHVCVWPLIHEHLNSILLKFILSTLLLILNDTMRQNQKTCNYMFRLSYLEEP